MLRQALTALESELQECVAVRAHFEAEENRDLPLRAFALEAALVKAVRGFDAFVESAFIAYLCGEVSLDGHERERLVTATDQTHARRLLGARTDDVYLSWESVQGTLLLAEIFLTRDHPLRVALVARQEMLNSIRRVRNRSAHDSIVANSAYLKVLGSILTAQPKETPSPGEFLAMQPRRGPLRGRVVFAAFTETLEEVAGAIACKPAEA